MSTNQWGPVFQETWTNGVASVNSPTQANVAPTVTTPATFNAGSGITSTQEYLNSFDLEAQWNGARVPTNA
jgi:hypothetical protein